MTTSTTATKTRPSVGGRRPSEQAIDAAIEGATRLLRLPTFRDRYGEIADAAGREQLSYRAFLSELLLAECDDREQRRAARRVHDAAFPRPKASRISTSPRTPRSTRRRSTPSPAAVGSPKASRCA